MKTSALITALTTVVLTAAPAVALATGGGASCPDWGCGTNHNEILVTSSAA